MVYNTITPQLIRDSVNKVIADEACKAASKRIGDSFVDAGGISKAADDIFRYKDKLGL